MNIWKEGAACNRKWGNKLHNEKFYNIHYFAKYHQLQEINKEVVTVKYDR
jgi:hypothetical protein